MTKIETKRALVLAALLAVLSPPVDADDTPRSSMRQSFDLSVPMPPTPVSVTGTLQLVYELHLTNFAPMPLVLEQVEVLDAHAMTVIAAVSGDTLARRLDRLHAPPVRTDPRTIDPGMRGVLYFEIALADDARPRTLEHRVSFHDADQDRRQVSTVQGARTTINDQSPVVLHPPLRGGPWLALYDPAWERGHRRVIYTFEGRARIPDRFAIDWVKLDTDGRRARGNENTVSNWYSYGADVLAVADAVVMDVRDDIPESTTLSGRLQYRFEDATGNYIVLDLGHGRYAFYKHLKPGSIQVAPGERVQHGQVIGAVGFSGSAGGPQLHFHVADANSPLGVSEGLPFVFTRFNMLGIYDNPGALGNTPWAPVNATTPARRTGELPAPGAVVDFGAGAPN